MDPTLSKHLQELIHPLLVRIENLERNNEELRERVRLLENQLPHEHNYQKNTSKCGNTQSAPANTSEKAESAAKTATAAKDPPGTAKPKSISHHSRTVTQSHMKKSKPNRPSPR